MSLLKGKFNLSRFMVPALKGKTDTELRNLFKQHVVSPIEPDDNTEVSSGWSTLSGGTELGLQAMFLGNYCAMGFRFDFKKVDSAGVKRAVAEQIKKWIEDAGVRKCPKDVKQAIKESVKDEALTAALPSTVVYSVIIDTIKGIAYTDVPSGPKCDVLCKVLSAYGEVEPVYGHGEYFRMCKPIGEQTGLDFSNEGIPTVSGMLTTMVCEGIAGKLKEVSIGNMAKLVGTNGAGDKEITIRFPPATASKELIEALRGRCSVTCLEFCAELGDQLVEYRFDTKGKLIIKVPNPDGAEIDDRLAARMVHIEAACSIFDRLYVDYANNKTEGVEGLRFEVTMGD